MRAGLAALVACACVGTAGATSHAALPPLPKAWPRTLQLGAADLHGGAAALDNRVEWLFDDGPARTHLRAYARAGVIAFLFGRGADGATCACDAAKDGVTNPEPVNGTRASLSADDDGGNFEAQAGSYYRAGALPLP